MRWQPVKFQSPGHKTGALPPNHLAGLTSLTAHAAGREALNASVGLASTQADTLKRIDGTELPLIMPWLNSDDRGPALDPSASARPDHFGQGPGRRAG